MKIRTAIIIAIMLSAPLCCFARHDTFTVSEVPESIRCVMAGRSYPDGCRVSFDDLRYLIVSYRNFQGDDAIGEIVCNKLIAEDLIYIFRELYEADYRIARIRLIDFYDADDERSMADDNTSCFNYRVAPNTGYLSMHAYGLAIDINPMENPYVNRQTIRPAGASVSRTGPYAIDKDDLCCKLFLERGFIWGGGWASMKDYQHFEKPSLLAY